jgi:hypothetical protein
MSSDDEENFSIPTRPSDLPDESAKADESASDVEPEVPRAVFIAGDPEGLTLGEEYAEDEEGSTEKGVLEDLIERVRRIEDYLSAHGDYPPYDLYSRDRDSWTR